MLEAFRLRNDPVQSERFRVRVVALSCVAGLALLGGRFWHLQVTRTLVYQERFEQQSMRRVRIPGARGLILARDGTRLADNEPAVSLALYLEELRVPGAFVRTRTRVLELLDLIEPVLGRPPVIGAADIDRHRLRELPIPLVAWPDLTPDEMARVAERVGPVPGLDFLIEPRRVYPHGSMAAHLLGYVGRLDPAQFPEEDRFHFLYHPDTVGRTGLEQSQDARLRGEAGGRLVRVDVAGFRHDEIAVREPVPGWDIQVALDPRLQAAAEAAMEGESGAVVVVDPRNGDVLAMASYPAFDPNEFIPAISAERFRALQGHPGHPFVNRAIAGRYPPGSVFKPVVALAALEDGSLSRHARQVCGGSLTLGNQTFRCWLHRGHGDLDVVESLRTSCNVFYYRQGLQTGPAPIRAMSARLGLGAASGIDLSGESAGLIPSPFRWSDGDTANLVIGQGALLVTPLQMAMASAAVANGGTLFRPRLVTGVRPPGADRFEPVPPEVARRAEIPAAALDAVREGMRQSVMHPGGTGRNAAVPGLEVAGKTGTAQFGPREEGRTRGWMIAYAPLDAPRIALALVVDDAVSGGVSAAPRIRRILETAFAPGGGEVLP